MDDKLPFNNFYKLKNEQKEKRNQKRKFGSFFKFCCFFCGAFFWVFFFFKLLGFNSQESPQNQNEKPGQFKKLKHFTFQLIGCNSVLFTFSKELLTEQIEQQLFQVGANPNENSRKRGFVLNVKAYLTFLAFLKEKSEISSVKINEVPSLASELSLYPIPTFMSFSTSRQKNVKIEYEDYEYDLVFISIFKN